MSVDYSPLCILCTFLAHCSLLFSDVHLRRLLYVTCIPLNLCNLFGYCCFLISCRLLVQRDTRAADMGYCSRDFILWAGRLAACSLTVTCLRFVYVFTCPICGVLHFAMVLVGLCCSLWPICPVISFCLLRLCPVVLFVPLCAG